MLSHKRSPSPQARRHGSTTLAWRPVLLLAVLLQACGDDLDARRYRAEPRDDADFLFDEASLHTYDLQVAPADLAFLDADPAAEVYVPATLRFPGQPARSVGLRYKGSIGAFAGCVGGGSFSQPAGPKTCQKLSMKVKLNWDGQDEQRLFGLKKLQFHAMNSDPSLMRERLGYRMFRRMGVPAPRAVHARLVLNGEYQGVFVLVEQVDGRFTRSRFADGKGNLYKEVWPLTQTGTPHPASTYLAALETNEEEPGVSADRMRRFAQAVAGAEDVLPVLDDWTNLDHSLRLVAVDRAILNDDGVFHWYCGGAPIGACAPHNFYWYEETRADRLYLIPWDLDLALRFAHPITSLNTDWNQVTNNCRPYRPAGGRFPLRDAACDPIVAAWTERDDLFAHHSRRFLEGPFAKTSVESALERWWRQVEPAVREAERIHPDAITVAEAEAALAELKVDLEEMRRRLQARL